MRPDEARRWPALVAATLLVAPLAVLPVRALADVWRAPAVLPQEWGTRAVAYVASGNAGTLRALGLSVVVGVLTTVLALVLGWPVARGAARRGARGYAVVATFVALPLLVPEFATGTGLAAWFLRLGLADTVVGLVLAHLVYVFPYVVLILAPGFRAELTDLEEAAAALGAGPWQRLWHVSIPTLRSYVATATLLGFIVSLSQYGTSLAVGGGRPTLPLLLVPFVQTDPQIAAALGVVFLVPAIVALALAARAGRQPV
ncbi:MAG: ABC transporter permease subunit [Nitriliruptorales bacterium]|nr:ABC transporter permease subunit [Nitriliruptorales bacterium]